MSELISQIARHFFETTPAFARDRVANALLKLSEQRLATAKDGKNEALQTQAIWYDLDRKKSSDKQNSMGLNERIWFLLEGSIPEKDQWVEIMENNDGDAELYELAEVFGYKSNDEYDESEILGDPSEIRQRLFNDFLIQLHDPEEKIKRSFRRKLAKLNKGSFNLSAGFHKRVDPRRSIDVLPLPLVT